MARSSGLFDNAVFRSDVGLVALRCRALLRSTKPPCALIGVVYSPGSIQPICPSGRRYTTFSTPEFMSRNISTG